MKYHLSFIFLIFIAGSVGFGQSADLEQEFQEREAKAKLKFKGFFEHKKLKEKEAKLREESREEHRFERQKLLKQSELARKEYILTKKKRVQVSDEVFEQEAREKLARREKNRKQYIKRRTAMERFINKLPKIPEEEEVGIK